MGTIKQPVHIEPDLYERDFCERANYMAARLKARDVNALDWDNLAEEMEGLARSDRKELYSRIEALIMHLLKWKIQTEFRSGS
jgi:hypothetical protein